MHNQLLKHNRFVWLFLIVMVSLGLVGVALAAASNQGNSVNGPVNNNQPPGGGGQPAQALPASPVQVATKAPVSQPPPDQTLEKMRLEAMAASQASGNCCEAGDPAGLNRLEFWQSSTNLTSIWGGAEPSTTVTITTSTGDTLHGFADCLGNWGADQAVILHPGDLITVTDNAGSLPLTVTFPEMQVDSDSASDEVFGHIGWANWLVEIHPDWEGGNLVKVSDANGDFTQPFVDVPKNGRGFIRFQDNVGPNNVYLVFHHTWYDLVPTLNVNYANGWDWVEGQYDPGYEVAITVTNPLGVVKGTAHGVTGDPGWGGDTGFATWSSITPWDGVPPDIQAFDHVYIRVENGRTGDVELGEINGTLDLAADTFNGSLDIPWLTGRVRGDCGVWVQGGPGMNYEGAEANGGTFACDFGLFGWDLQAGQDVGVSYYDPDGDHVLNVFSAPAPHLWINLEQMGQPAFGNNMALRIHYNNDGRATAMGVSITQQLFGMTYLSDTSGVIPSVSGNTITWELGDLPVNYLGDSWFDVFVHIDDSTSVSSIGDIATSEPFFQGDQGSMHFEWGTDVIDNATDLNIGKWSWTGDPAAGQEYVYVVNVCNNGPTASSEVIVTDTIPLSTTFAGMVMNEPGWEVVATSPNLVFSRPTVNGYRCNEVDFKVLLSSEALPGLQLHNQATVWSASDLTPENNFADHWAGVNVPWRDLHIGPNWVSGEFVAGGYMDLQYWVANWGNMPMPGTLVTTTLPAGTEFDYAYTWDWQGNHLFEPTVVTDDHLVWDLGTLPNGYNINFGVHLKITEDAQPGTLLEVENHVSGDAVEVRYDDNTLVYTEEVNENGPNLRVDKHTNWWWNSWDNSARELNYELRILNIGTERQENVVITDTYPESTTVGGCGWNHGPGNLQDCEVDEANHQVIWRLEYMDPGNTASAWLRVELAPEDAGVQGLEFVNMADISDFEDVNPEDNHDEVTSKTGADLFVRKWLKAGELRAGETVTYTVEIGNLNRWPWNGDWSFGTHVTDTLPVGMTFIKSVPYSSGTMDPQNINGQQVVWEVGTMCADCKSLFDLVVQIDEDVPPNTELLNTIDILSDGPAFEINPADNHFELSLFTSQFHFLLPITQNAP